MPLSPAPVRRPEPVYPLDACMLWWQPRQSGWGAILRRPTLLWVGNVPARGSGAAQSLAERSADFGHLEGVLTGRSDHLATPCHTLARLVGKAAKRTIGRVLVPYHASRD